MRPQFYRLMLITHKGKQNQKNYLEFIKKCTLHGVTSVQLREKNLTYDELLDFGQALKAILRPLNIPLIVNDSIQLAKALDAEGLHLGQNDGCPKQARASIGAHKILGLSANTIEKIKTANQLPVDYIGCGAVFKTYHKANASILGIDKLKMLRQYAKHPCIAIGGITPKNSPQVLQTGVHGIAAIAPFHQATSPEDLTKRWIHTIHMHQKTNT